MNKAVKARKGTACDSYCPTVIEFLLDETGSMATCQAATVSGYNAFLTEQRAQQGTALMTLTKFDTSGQKTPYTDLDIRMVVPMNENMFLPGGGTNLRDTLGDRIASLKERLVTWAAKPNVLVVVMTDGEDNASRRYSDADIARLIRDHEAEGWTFVYLGSTSNALDIARRMGFHPGNTKRFEASEMYRTMSELAHATTVYRATQDSKGVATRSFFSK